MKTLESLTVEDAKIITGIIRPYDDKSKHTVIRNDRDYLVFRTDSYMVEEIWFYKSNNYAGSDKVLSIYNEKADINYDLIFLAYLKLISLGYTLPSIDKKQK